MAILPDRRKIMYYVNMKLSKNAKTETVDEAKTIREAVEMLGEYQMSDKISNYWVSDKCTNDWRKKS
ncbi:MAG: hypothetical protein ACTSQB_00285 [Candidatus Heimdallarchaeota archaeon]